MAALPRCTSRRTPATARPAPRPPAPSRHAADASAEHAAPARAGSTSSLASSLFRACSPLARNRSELSFAVDPHVGFFRSLLGLTLCHPVQYPSRKGKPLVSNSLQRVSLSG